MKYSPKKDNSGRIYNKNIPSCDEKSGKRLSECLFHKSEKNRANPIGIKENKDLYKIDVEVPDISEEELNVDIKESHVTISTSGDSENFEQTFYYPKEVDTANANFEFSQGVLKINLPKLNFGGKIKRRFQFG